MEDAVIIVSLPILSVFVFGGCLAYIKVRKVKPRTILESRKLQLTGYCTDYFLHEVDSPMDEEDLDLLYETYEEGLALTANGLYPEKLLRCWNVIRRVEGLEAVK